MESTKVCMVVKKEAIGLSEAVFCITIIAETEEGCPTEETWKNIRILRPPKDSTHRNALREKVIGASVKENDSLKSRIIKLLQRNRGRNNSDDAFTG